MKKVQAIKGLIARITGTEPSGDTVSEVLESAYPETTKEIILASSTENSTKRFKITVIDDGTISATEIQ